jgi:transposase-like protein
MEGNFQICEVKICDNYNKNDDNYTKFFALHQQEKIIQTARILNSFG